jgi:hypothetical protein
MTPHDLGPEKDTSSPADTGDPFSSSVIGRRNRRRSGQSLQWPPLPAKPAKPLKQPADREISGPMERQKIDC